MSNVRSLVPALEASIRHVKGIKWKAILDVHAEMVSKAIEEKAKYRHTSCPTADRNLLQALGDYFAMSEQMRLEMGQV